MDSSDFRFFVFHIHQCDVFFLMHSRRGSSQPSVPHYQSSRSPAIAVGSSFNRFDREGHATFFSAHVNRETIEQQQQPPLHSPTKKKAALCTSEFSMQLYLHTNIQTYKLAGWPSICFEDMMVRNGPSCQRWRILQRPLQFSPRWHLRSVTNWSLVQYAQHLKTHTHYVQMYTVYSVLVHTSPRYRTKQTIREPNGLKRTTTQQNLFLRCSANLQQKRVGGLQCSCIFHCVCFDYSRPFSQE